MFSDLTFILRGEDAVKLNDLKSKRLSRRDVLESPRVQVRTHMKISKQISGHPAKTFLPRTKYSIHYYLDKYDLNSDKHLLS